MGSTKAYWSRGLYLPKVCLCTWSLFGWFPQFFCFVLFLSSNNFKIHMVFSPFFFLFLPISHNLLHSKISILVLCILFFCKSSIPVVLTDSNSHIHIYSFGYPWPSLSNPIFNSSQFQVSVLHRIIFFLNYFN